MCSAGKFLKTLTPFLISKLPGKNFMSSAKLFSSSQLFNLSFLAEQLICRTPPLLFWFCFF